MPKSVHLNLGDEENGPGFQCLAFYMDEHGNSGPPDPNSPAHMAAVQLLRHLDTLGQRTDLKSDDPREYLSSVPKETPEEPLIVVPPSSATH